LTASRAMGGKIILVGAGVGITPIRALMADFPADAQIDLIYRAEEENDLVLKSEIDEISAKNHVKVHYLIGPPQEFPMSPAQLRELIPHIAECEVFVCGPPGLAKIVRHSAEALGVKSSNFHNEAFAFNA
jgi:ferredoxin-NADP reductase